jgi:hypothetical protein
VYLYKVTILKDNYLNEARLGEHLKVIFPDNEFVHDKPVPDSSNKRRRPDYRCDELMLIVEFDGISHYQNINIILSDIEKDKDYSSLGYRVLRIPYFVQLDKTTTYNIFGIALEEELYSYPQGFIDKKATLPASFCYNGLMKFEEDLKRFYWLSPDILYSLESKIQELGEERVLPKPLLHLITQ